MLVSPGKDKSLLQKNITSMTSKQIGATTYLIDSVGHKHVDQFVLKSTPK